MNGRGKGASDRLRFVRRVTRQHGAAFSARLCEETVRSEAVYEAFMAAGVMQWPASEDDYTPAKDRYVTLQEEILGRTLDYAGHGIAAAFQRAAHGVIERERKRQRRTKDRKP